MDTVNSYQWLSVSWTDEHPLVVLFDSVLFLSQGLLVSLLLLLALAMKLAAMRVWQSQPLAESWEDEHDPA